MSRWKPHPVVEEQVTEAEVNLAVDEHVQRERVRTLQECVDLLLAKMGNDWTCNAVIAELRRRIEASHG